MQKALITNLESLFNRDEECVEAIGLEQRLLLVHDHTLIERSDAVWSDVEWVGVCQERQGVWVVDFVRAAISCWQRNQNIVDDVENLKEFVKTLGALFAVYLTWQFILHESIPQESLFHNNCASGKFRWT